MAVKNAKAISIYLTSAAVVYSIFAGCWQLSSKSEMSSNIVKTDAEGNISIIARGDTDSQRSEYASLGRLIPQNAVLQAIDVSDSTHANALLIAIQQTPTRELVISNCKVSLGAISPYLRSETLTSLRANATQFDKLDETILELSAASYLRELSLDEVVLSSESLRTIGKLAKVEQLSLNHCGLEDNTLRQLSGMEVESLSLASNFLSNSCVDTFRSLEKLKKLDVRHNPDFGDDALKALLESNPNITVYIDPPDIDRYVDPMSNKITAPELQNLRRLFPRSNIIELSGLNEEIFKRQD